MTRRFLPVILPGALLFAAAAALGGIRGGPVRRRGSRAASVSCSWRSWRCTTPAPRGPSSVTSSTRASFPSSSTSPRSVGDRDLLIVESRNASDTHVLALPLAYIYARNVLVLSTRCPDKRDVRGVPRLGAHAYDRVLFLGGGGTDLAVAPLGRPAGRERPVPGPGVRTRRSTRTRGSCGQKEFDYSLYELTPPAAATGRPFDLDVGVRDDLHVSASTRRNRPRAGRSGGHATRRISRSPSLRRPAPRSRYCG